VSTVAKLRVREDEPPVFHLTGLRKDDIGSESRVATRSLSGNCEEWNKSKKIHSTGRRKTLSKFERLLVGFDEERRGRECRSTHSSPFRVADGVAGTGVCGRPVYQRSGYTPGNFSKVMHDVL
jgi:hypothetical protein